MRRALFDNWTLFLGMLMLMVANGLLVTLLTIRGEGLGFSDFTISIMQACYPIGALVGTVLAPKLVDRVGHIRAFSALASLVSIGAIIHLLTRDPYSWSAMRLLSGFCYPGLYVISESWLNAKAENRIRAQVLSIYFVIQMIGPALGTAMVGMPDPSGNLLFGIVSILISLSIVPLLLSATRAPDYSVPERMSVRKLARISPMAVFGILLVNVAVGAWFIALPLYGLQLGFTAVQASGALVIALLAGALIQYPVGWLSDRMDRRYVVIALGFVALLASLWMAVDGAPGHLVIGFALIAMATLPGYSILVAHANDQLRPAQIVPASGAMGFCMNLGIFLGTLIGPNVLGVAGGRGLPMALALISAALVMVAVARRLHGAAEAQTGEAQALPVIGLAQPSTLHADSAAGQENREVHRGNSEESSV